MFKQIVNTFFTKILSGLLSLVVAIVISNYLGANGKGLQGLILTSISIIVVFTGIVGPGGLTYLLPRMHFSLVVIPGYIWSIFIVSIMWAALSLTSIIPEEYNIHVVILSLILSTIGINNSILHVKKLIQKVNLISIIQILITVIVLCFLIIYKEKLSVKSYIIGMYFGVGISAFISFLYTRTFYINAIYSFSIFKYLIGIKNHLKFGGYNQLDVLAQLLSFRLAYFILNHFISTAEVGIYSNAVSLIEAIWIISRSISFVQHSRIVNSRDKKFTQNLTLKFIKLTGSLAIIAIFVLIMIPSGAYKYIFGEEFGGIRMAIISLAPGVFFFSLSFIISSYFSGTGKHYINSLSSIVGLIVISIFSFIFIPSYGIIGAGIAASVSYLTTTTIKIYYFTKLTEINLIQLIPVKSDLKNLFQLIKSLKEE
jgi:O-antigen/teichoic acid export membrane protein